MRALFLAFLSMLLIAQPATAQRALPQPTLIALYFYADWCPNCKALSPLVGEARTTYALDKQDILFVTLDLTDKTRIHQTLLLAQALGVGAYVQKQGSATGYVAVLDATSKKEVARFDRANTSEQIGESLRQLAAAR